MNKFLAGLFIFGLSLTIGICVMIYGWGLEPKSWWWILGGGVVLRILVETFGLISKAQK